MTDQWTRAGGSVWLDALLYGDYSLPAELWVDVDPFRPLNSRPEEETSQPN
jgi:hypothetical protein